MTDARLDTGMKPEEAVERAAKWWDKTGRGMVNREFNRRTDRKVSTSKTGPMLISQSTEDDLPSGILRGVAWEALTKAEQLEVVRIWHHEHVRMPQVEERLTELPGEKHVLTVRCDCPTHPGDEPDEARFDGLTVEDVYREAKLAGWVIREGQDDLCPGCAQRLLMPGGQGAA